MSVRVVCLYLFLGNVPNSLSSMSFSSSSQLRTILLLRSSTSGGSFFSKTIHTFFFMSLRSSSLSLPNSSFISSMPSRMAWPIWALTAVIPSRSFVSWYLSTLCLRERNSSCRKSNSELASAFSAWEVDYLTVSRPAFCPSRRVW